MLRRKVANVMSKVVCGGEGCIGWMTNIVVTGGERHKSESTSGGVRVKLSTCVDNQYMIQHLLFFVIYVTCNNFHGDTRSQVGTSHVLNYART